jgi:LPXTG-motif cell wall-anchored protein
LINKRYFLCCFKEEKMKKTKKIFVAMMTLALMLVFIPTTAMADTVDPEATGVVAVSISNNTYDEGVWTGEHLSELVDLVPGMTLGDAVKAACEQAGVSVTGATAAEGGFISDIDGLSSGAAGGYSGWMFTVDNWFNTTGLNAPAQDGDWISVQYSVDGMGADLGSIFSPKEDANNKTLTQILFDEGTLAPEFAPDVHSYTLTVPAGTTNLFAMPQAFNLNYQVHTTVDGTDYKLMNGVPIADGTMITMTCGDPSWPSMNNGQYGTGAEEVAAQVYEITIAYDETVDNGGGGVDNGGTDNGGEVTVEKDDSPKTGDANTMLPLAMLLGLIGIGGVVASKRRTN